MSVEIEVQIARAEERIEALERWQKAQNGQLKDLSIKLDHMSEKIDVQVGSLYERINGVNRWLVGVLTSSLMALLLLVANLVIGRP